MCWIGARRSAWWSPEQEELRVAMHVLDKGGVTVVEEDGGVITTWNSEEPVRRPRSEAG